MRNLPISIRQILKDCVALAASLMRSLTILTVTMVLVSCDKSSSQDYVWIPEGVFEMGAQSEMFTDALPVHEVFTSGFWMSKTEVTNRQFAKFVEETNYLTLAERPLSKDQYPHLSDEDRQPGGLVFSPPDNESLVDMANSVTWWKFVPGANWRHPEGPLTSIAGRENHPVVHIAYEDALAYTRWSNTRLPTEAEWEKAARGGLALKKYVWGDDLMVNGRHMANIFQGKFPVSNTAEDGFLQTSPVKHFPPNGYGLHGMAGNVWEWTQDSYNPLAYRSRALELIAINPREETAEEFAEYQVIRGGSFACSPDFCARYMPGSREKAARDTSSNHIGFRVVKID